MEAPSSRLHRMCGCGWPLAAHVSDTFDPSRTTVSVLDSLSIISGGTIGQQHTNTFLFKENSLQLFKQKLLFTDDFDVSFLIAHWIRVYLGRIKTILIKYNIIISLTALSGHIPGTCRILDQFRRHCLSSSPSCAHPLALILFGNSL
jgi:hypothetical protein